MNTLEKLVLIVAAIVVAAVLMLTLAGHVLVIDIPIGRI